MDTFAAWLNTIVRDNQETFRVFGPDETQSNHLSKIYESGKKVWVNGYLPEDADGGNLSPKGRVMEMLSEHTVEGWLEGFVLSGRHGMLNSVSGAPFFPGDKRIKGKRKKGARTVPVFSLVTRVSP